MKPTDLSFSDTSQLISTNFDVVLKQLKIEHPKHKFEWDIEWGEGVGGWWWDCWCNGCIKHWHTIRQSWRDLVRIWCDHRCCIILCSEWPWPSFKVTCMLDQLSRKVLNFLGGIWFTVEDLLVGWMPYSFFSGLKREDSTLDFVSNNNHWHWLAFGHLPADLFQAGLMIETTDLFILIPI